MLYQSNFQKLNCCCCYYNCRFCRKLNLFCWYCHNMFLDFCNKQLYCKGCTNYTRENNNNCNQNQSQDKDCKGVIILHEMGNSYSQNHNGCHSSSCSHQWHSIDSGYALSYAGNCLHCLTYKHH